MAKKALNDNDMIAMAKDAVRAGREWHVAVREVNMSSMVHLMKWNPQMSSMMEPWLEMTRSADDYLLDVWEAQTQSMIDSSAHIIEQVEPQMLRMQALVRPEKIAST